MNLLIRFALVIPTVLMTACGSLHDTPDLNSCLVEVTSPSAPIPEINASVGIETGDVLIFWTSCEGAVCYELQRADIPGGWYQLYSGIETDYYLGVEHNDGPAYFRVRAVYDSFVGDWSSAITI